MKIYKEPVVEIMLICDFNDHNSDFFLIKKKRRLGRDSWGLYVVIYFIKTTLALSHFFLPRKHFLLKTPCDFRPFFPRKRVAFLPRTLKIRSNGFFDPDFLETGPLL